MSCSRTRCLAASALLVVLGACRPELPLSLVDHSLWREVDAASDPFPDRPETVSCAPTSWQIEVYLGVPGFEVDTTFCDYVTLEQTLLWPVRKGETITALLNHGDLLSPEPASGHMAILIGEDLWLTDVERTIPRSSATWVDTIESPKHIAAGTPIYLHIHNHGDNTWRVDDIAVGVPE